MSEKTQTVCPHCGAVNIVPTERLDESPNCGRCSEAIFTGAPIELDDNSLARHLGRTEQPLLVDFWAEWCGPCKAMAPQFAAAARELEPQVRLGKLDTENARSSAARFNIRSIPTMILFIGGEEIARQSGALQSAQIVNWVRSQIQ